MTKQVIPKIVITPEPERAQWGNQVEFLLTMISFAVGLGNVWRFPYLAYSNGGGAFLIPYALSLVFLGLPLFYLETALGQYAGLGPTKAWEVSPLFIGCGWSSIIITSVTALYYNVLIAYILYYFAMSLTDQLPWTSCSNGNNTWATPFCTDFNPKNILSNATTETAEVSTTAIYETISSTVQLQGTCDQLPNVSHLASEDYFYNNAMEMSDGIEFAGGLRWQLVLALLVAWIVVGGVLIRGVQSLGKFVYVTAIFPYIMLTVLLVNNCTQTNAKAGILFYLTPNFQQLMNFEVWTKAATQIFFSLSVCNGGLLVMASFNKFRNNIYRDSVLVPVLNCCTSVYAGFAIFSALGYMAYVKGVPDNVGSVATSGPELAFVTYPAALAAMPVAPLWSVLFFLMMALLGFGSEFSLAEAALMSVIDQFPNLLNKSKVRTMSFRVAGFVFLFILGLPQVTQGGLYLLMLVNDTIGGLPLLVCGFFEVIAVSWVYGLTRFCSNVEEMVDTKVNYYWKAMWLVFTPLLLAILIVTQLIDLFTKPMTYVGFKFTADCPYVYPWWAQGLAWMIRLAPCLPIPIGFVYQWRAGVLARKAQVATDGSLRLLWEGLKLASKPTKNWMSQLERKKLSEQSALPPETGVTNQAFDGDKNCDVYTTKY